jgi:hypothetical protein
LVLGISLGKSVHENRVGFLGGVTSVAAKENSFDFIRFFVIIVVVAHCVRRLDICNPLFLAEVRETAAVLTTARVSTGSY